MDSHYPQVAWLHSKSLLKAIHEHNSFIRCKTVEQKNQLLPDKERDILEV